MSIGQDITASDSPCYEFVTGPSQADFRRIATSSDAAVATEANSHGFPSPA